MSAVLLVRLKIPDLTALTALDTARALLPNDLEISRLVREELYLFEEAPGVLAGRFEAVLANAVETSNFFVNPNKERYRFLASDARGEAMAPPEGSWGILTRPRGETRDDGLRDRLLREHPLEGLGAIRRGRVWWLATRSTDGSAGIQACHVALGPVVGPSRGLLVNPHSEASLLLEGPVPWRRIESFLAEDAPAFERTRSGSAV